jgi:hypothetical protein
VLRFAAQKVMRSVRPTKARNMIRGTDIGRVGMRKSKEKRAEKAGKDQP